MQLNSIEEIVEDLRAGKMVIIMDDEDRENEGDLLIAAESVQAEDINFMARYARGLICLTLTEQRCKDLRLWLQVTENESRFSTNFTVSIEAAEGVTTGISAADRACTVQAAVAKNAKPEDLVQPGHIFPIMARPGGVLTRAGHTEAGCDFARLAGFDPSAVIVEILNEDGSMARRPDLELFAREHGLKIGTIADLIHYRLKNEQSVHRLAESELPTAHGSFRLVAYQSAVDDKLHYALTKGVIDAESPVLVRVHMQDVFSDLFASSLDESSWPLDDALSYVAAEGSGVVVVLSNEDHAEDVVRRMQEMHHSKQASAAKSSSQQTVEWRTYGMGAQILVDLGVKKMRVLSAPKKFLGMSGFELEVTEYISEPGK